MTNNSQTFNKVLGVDVSKAKLDLAWADGKETWAIENSDEAITRERIGRIQDRSTTIVVLEATGSYESLLVSLLHQHKIAVAVINPRRIRQFAEGIGRDAKTDPIDAAMIAFYGQVRGSSFAKCALWLQNDQSA